jgi:hypoxanthine phosphoribosyltransferase
VAELGAELGAALGRPPEPPLLVAILKGSTLFLADLVRALPLDAAVDFMAISSYGQGSGVVRIVKDLDQQVEGRDVVIVEDIVDTGLTLTYLRRQLAERAPASVRAVTLLDKRARRLVPVPVEHAGFEVPDVFVVGYGLDFQGLYRNLPDIYAVDDLARLAARRDLLVAEVFASRAQRAAGGSLEP